MQISTYVSASDYDTLSKTKTKKTVAQEMAEIIRKEASARRLGASEMVSEQS